jgi:hypothetical protein
VSQIIPVSFINSKNAIKLITAQAIITISAIKFKASLSIITYFVKLPSDETRKKWAEEYLEQGMKTQTELEASEQLVTASDSKPT